MIRERNDEVVKNWSEGLCSMNHRGSFHTNGQQLWSYELLIGDTCLKTGKKVLREYMSKGKWGFRTQTTSCHVSMARRHADVID